MGERVPTITAEESPLVRLPAITLQTSIGGLGLPYRNHLITSDHTTHTVDCFMSDLRLFAKFVGPKTPIGEITREHLVSWLMHLKFGSDEKPAPKTMARRVTFLKNFFGWLAKEGVLSDNIAATLNFARPLPPLPDLLFEDELARLLVAAKDDSRCQLLILLALDGGLKKEEILALTRERVDISEAERPTISVRLPGQSRPQRERLMEMPSHFTTVYQRFVHEYRPRDVLFDCTDRNLTYILARAVKRAALTKRVTLQLLRDCYAVRQLRGGTSLAELREKLGLSDEAWYEAQEKYRKLAFPA
jgi:integrase/recombinase XerD